MKEPTIATYTTGYVLSIALTLLAFLLVGVHAWSQHAVFSHGFLYAAIVVCALVQAAVQLTFFLHLGKRGNGTGRAAFAFAAVLVVIVVGGALWIMGSLNSRMAATPEQMMQYMDNESGAL
jgi:cytochrome o ubiquinol oxidase operon protein cyoD